MPATVIELGRAKINLSLHVVGRRADGYHLLDSVVAFADIADRLTFAHADRFELAVTGPFARHVPTGEDNLVVRAARALSRASRDEMAGARVKLEKNLPVAAGLGGGSADAAAVLRGLARLLAVDSRIETLHEIGAALGADVPVCLRSRAARIGGIGEIVEPIGDFRPWHAVLVNPGVAVNTADVFRELKFAGRDAASSPCRNDLMAPAIGLAPVIGEVIAQLERQRDIKLARMSGSGATCFGLFPSAVAAEKASDAISADHPDWWCRATVLS